MTLEEIKALGAPFQAAEVQISRRKQISRLVLLVRDGEEFRTEDIPGLDFPWHGNLCDSAEELGQTILDVAKTFGIIADDAATEIVDLDLLAKTAS